LLSGDSQREAVWDGLHGGRFALSASKTKGDKGEYMRNGLLFVHIISACVLVGGLILRIVFVPLSRALRTESEAKIAIFLQARASHFLNMCAVLFLLATGYFLAQNFGGIAAQRWIWVSLLLTIFASALVAVAGNQEEQLSKKLSVTGWSRFFRFWLAEISLSTISVLIVLYLMVGKPF
jgi:uncharacterized membrane protein